MMKKQVTFAENLRLHRLHDEALPRMNRFKTAALKDVGVNINRPTAARRQPQLMQIPKTLTTGPFLKHTALTPAQKEFLYSVAASSSPAHVRDLITQHYMSILHRRTRAGYSPDTDDLDAAAAAATSENMRDKRQIKKQQSDASFRLKHKEKTNAAARRSGKSFLPNITHRENRRSNAAASKHGKPQKRETTASTLRRESPRVLQTGARVMMVMEEEEEEEVDDSLSDCLSSLSVEESDADAFSDL
ncbi:protein FAM216A [Mugil cephalus]|uniref:protein FAM216A n=1 Tax=Mugil cephalus TaxID=48193 RepID=UPI001FB6F924|nr:protein FAM216A [Mugil cephalus]